MFVPELPSVATQGETVEEAVAMAKDAIEGYLETMRDEGWEVPRVRRERVSRPVAAGAETTRCLSRQPAGVLRGSA